MSDSIPALLEGPEGTRDLLFEGARRIRACEAAVAHTFSAAGYEEVIPPVIERAELYEGMPALRASDSAGRQLALRADFTAQVARIAATRLRGRAPLRLWYRGPILRDVAPGRMTPRERLQCGLELLGEPGVDADGEVLALAARALDVLGFDRSEVRISAGSTAYFAALLEHASLPAAVAGQLRDAIDRKDKAGTVTLAAGLADARLRDAFAFLAAPESQSSVLASARALAPGDAALAAIDRLEQVVSAASTAGLGDRLEVDLGEVRGLGYYTGLVFNLYVTGAAGPVGGGGRYDSLLARYSDPRPAVGFSLDLDVLAPLAHVAEAA
jgi:ATP phosphoribosyltransferase regulatory subunit